VVTRQTASDVVAEEWQDLHRSEMVFELQKERCMCRALIRKGGRKTVSKFLGNNLTCCPSLNFQELHVRDRMRDLVYKAKWPPVKSDN
jgi:hypothetical protein